MNEDPKITIKTVVKGPNGGKITVGTVKSGSPDPPKR